MNGLELTRAVRTTCCAALVALLAGCFPNIYGAPCSSDEECPTGQACFDGKCSKGTEGTLPDSGTVPDSGTPPVEDGGTALVSLSPSSFDFGLIKVGDTGKPVTFTLKNDGTAAASGLAFAVSGTAAAAFAVTGSCAALAPGASCNVQVSFAPKSEGAAQAQLDVTGSNAVHAALSGAGYQPGALEMLPLDRDFGTVAQGTLSPDLSFTVKNNGSQPSGMLETSLRGTDGALFELRANGCAGQVLSSAQSCKVNVRFVPGTALGAKTASLLVSGAPGGSAVAQVSAMAIAPGSLSLSPSPAEFGSAVEKTQGNAVTLTVANTGSASSGALGAVTLSGSHAADFTVVTNGCAGQALAGGAQCTLSVRFDPQAAGERLATLEVPSASGGTAVAALRGTGLSDAKLSVSPATLDFGTLTTGTSSTVSVMVSNQGEVASTVPTVSIAGVQAAQFSHVSHCTAAIAPQQSCKVDITFSPPAPGGAAQATLTIQAATGGTVTVALSGTSVAPGALTVAPTSNNFGDLLVNTSGTAVSFTFSNTGGSSTGALSVVLGGAAASQFSIVTNGCTGALTPSGTCSVSVKFAPSAVGAQTAFLQATATPGGAAQATLVGNGMAPPSLGISPSTATFATTVTGNSSAAQRFTITNSGDAASSAVTVTLTGTQFAIVPNSDTCTGSGLAGKASCHVDVVFSPNTAGNASGSLSVQATAGGTAAASFSGLAQSPASLAFGVSSLDFGTADVAGAGTTLNIELRNSGTQPAGAPSFAFSDPNAGFSVVTGCAGVILNGTPCQVSLRFKPTSWGSKAVNMQASSTPGGYASAALTGIGRDTVTLTVTTTGNTSNNGNVTASGVVTSAPTGINCGSVCSYAFTRTTSNPVVVLSATPNATTSQGTVAWSGCTPVTGGCSVTLSAATTVSVGFSLKTYTWNLQQVHQGDASGSLSVNGTACACTTTRPYTFNYGDGVTMIATPTANANPGYTFSGWTGGPCAGMSGTTCTTSMVTSGYNISATFSPYNYMFVSSGAYAPGALGSFDPQGQNNGYRGADQLCQNLAMASTNASLKLASKTYKAWLASTTPYTDALARLTVGGVSPRGWVRADGRPFADTLKLPNGDDMLFGLPLLNENGALVASFLVMSAANGNGTPEWGRPGPCDGPNGNWSNTASPNGNVGGDVGSGSQMWSRSWGDFGCNTAIRLYCFGVNYNSPYGPPPLPANYHRFFATSNAGQNWDPSTGIAAADTLCNQEAAALSLCVGASCTYKAVLATAGSPALSAADRFTTGLTYPVYRLDNARVSNTLNDFFDGKFLAPPDGYANGRTVGGFYFVTGATTPRTAGTSGSTCNNWTTLAGATATHTQLGNLQARNVAADGSSTSSIWFGNLGLQTCAKQAIMCMN